MYPIAATVADELGIPVKAMTIAVMLGASSAWINPYGYQVGQLHHCDFSSFSELRTWESIQKYVLLRNHYFQVINKLLPMLLCI